MSERGRRSQVRWIGASTGPPVGSTATARLRRVARYGTQFGPDITFLGVDRCDLDEPESFAGADAVVVGAPFDGGTSYRSGARFGPQAIRMTDYLAHDGSRPSLALRTDGLQDLRVLDAGDVEMFSGDAATACAALEAEIAEGRRSRRDPGRARRRPHRHLAQRDRRRARAGLGPGQPDPLRRARRHREDRVRLADRARPADAAADRVRCGARRPLPAGRPARLLAPAGDAGLDGRAAHALVRDDRDRAPAGWTSA